MSNYRDFIRDYPTRCQTLLQTCMHSARHNGREVTLMLALASTGLIVPYERLIKSASSPHPSDDRTTFPAAAQEFSKLVKLPFVGSELLRNTSGAWMFGPLSSTRGDPDSWPELQVATPIAASKTIGRTLSHLRNSLAHGNIFTKGGTTVSSLVFVSKLASRSS